MKTITRQGTNISLYIFDDEEIILMDSIRTVVGNPSKFVIGDCNNLNSTLYENVVPPEDWQGWKYFYTDSGGWILNPDYVEPVTE